MLQRAICLLVIFAMSAAAHAQDGKAKEEKAVTPLTQAPFESMLGLWKRVETNQSYLGIDGYGRTKTCVRWVKLDPSETQIHIGDLSTSKYEPSDLPRFYHLYADRLRLDQAGTILYGFNRMDPSVIEVVNHDCFRSEFEDHFKERMCRVTSTCDGQTWWHVTEHQNPESGDWGVVSVEKYERIESIDPITPVTDGPELRLRTLSLPSGTVMNFRLAGDVLEHEFRLPNGLCTKLIVRLSEQDVASFWDFLASVRFREWETQYSRPGMMDGVGFRFRVVDGEDTFETRGSNKAPQRPDAEAGEMSLGLIAELRSELLRLVTEADQIYTVPEWTKAETLDW